VRARAAAAAVAAVLAGAAAPQAAEAGFIVGLGDGSLLFSAEAGEANRLTVDHFVDPDVGGIAVFTDENAPVEVLDAPCVNVLANQVICLAEGAPQIEVFAEDEDDFVEFTEANPIRALVRAGSGDDEVRGGPAGDQLNGEEGDDLLAGRGGDDELNGAPPPFAQPGADELDGGPGADELNGGGGPDVMRGGDARDVISGHAGEDVLDGDDGDDLLTAGDDADTLRGGEGADRLGELAISIAGLPPDRGDDLLQGGGGNDLLIPGAGPATGTTDADRIEGGGGIDRVTYERREPAVTVTIAAGADDGVSGERDDVAGDVEQLLGGQGGDRLVGGPGDEFVDGSLGADSISGGAGDDFVDGGFADDESDDVSGGPGADEVRGSAGDDNLTGDAGNDDVDGGGGDDVLTGGTGDDTLSGGAGRDSAAGGDGADTLRGAAAGGVGADGADSLRGDGGNDTLAGDDGDDVVAGGRGSDRLGGGAGNDTADYDEAASPVTVVLDGSANDGEAGERDNVLTDVENISGGGVQDSFTGNSGSNRLDGGSGQDFVDGRGGNDRLDGGAALDVVRARDGRRDVVDCGRGRDFAILDSRDVARNCERRDLGRSRARRGIDIVIERRARQPGFGIPGSTRTVPLLDRIAVPVRSAIDARRGTVRVATQRGRRSTQRGDIEGGIVRIVQSRRSPETQLLLRGGDFGVCDAGLSRAAGAPADAAQRRSRRRVRRLRVRGRGRFRTRGRYSSATIRGTDFSVEDRCDGTLTRVREGVVAVRDFGRRVTVIVPAGRSYLARAR
jgi:Ca2+-binding RTX toxin-like protein